MVLKFISSLSDSKKSLEVFSKSTFDQRLQILRAVQKIILTMKQEILLAESQMQGLTPDQVCYYSYEPFVKWGEQFLNSVGSYRGQGHTLPTGLISIMLPWTLSFRVMMEAVYKCLLHGNVVLVKPSSRSPETGVLLEKIFDRLAGEISADLFPRGVVKVFQGTGSELGSVMVNHPSVKGVFVCGHMATAEKIYKELPRIGKKVHFRHGFNNSFCLLDEGLMAPAIQTLLDSTLTGAGQWPWSPSRIYVLESMQKSFEEQLVKALQSRAREVSPLKSVHEKERLLKVYQELSAEKAQILFYDESLNKDQTLSPLAVRDLSHCSTFQQDEISGPVFLISPVKYQHEMVKWVNTSYYGGVAIIFGFKDKAEKFAAKLEVGTVFVNSWLENSLELPVGIKQSVSGFTDFGPESAFFFDQQKTVSPL